MSCKMNYPTFEEIPNDSLFRCPNNERRYIKVNELYAREISGPKEYFVAMQPYRLVEILEIDAGGER